MKGRDVLLEPLLKLRGIAAKPVCFCDEFCHLVGEGFRGPGVHSLPTENAVECHPEDLVVGVSRHVVSRLVLRLMLPQKIP